MEIEHAQVIAAPVDVVWRLTEDIEGWPATTPTVTAVERLDAGPLGVGSRARLHQPGLPPAVWTVTAFEPGRRFEWGTTVRGLRMVGVHHLEPAGDGCRNVLGLRVGGPLAAVLGPLVRGKLRRTLATENEGFRRAAEARVRGAAGTPGDG